MKRMICTLIIVALMALAVPAYAQLNEDPRLAELRVEFQKLRRQKLEIETRMIRLEGMFFERQSIIAEEIAFGIEGEVEVEAEVVE